MPRKRSNSSLLTLIIVFCIVIGGAISIIPAIAVVDWNKNYQTGMDKFEKAFLLELPPSAVISEERSDRDWRGDGLSFYIIKIDAEEIDQFINQPDTELRGELPIPRYEFERIEESINHSGLGRQFIVLAKNVSVGYYFYKETPLDTLTGDKSLNDTLHIFSIAVVDMESCYIYYLDVDMY